MNIKSIRLGNTLDWEHGLNVSVNNLNNLDKLISFSEYIRSVFMSKNVVDLGLFYSHCRIFDKGIFVDIEIYIYDWWYNDIVVLRRRKRKSVRYNVKSIDLQKSKLKYGNVTWIDSYYNKIRDNNLAYRKLLVNSLISLQSNKFNDLFTIVKKDFLYQGYSLDSFRRVYKDRYIFDYSLQWFFLRKKFNKVNYLYENKYSSSKDIRVLQILRLSFIEKLLVVSGYKFFNKKVNFSYCMLNERIITADLLSRYICFRLKQGYLLGEILSIVIKTIEKWKDKNLGVNGYRIECSGRFGRKQRTSFKSISVGKLFRSKVDSSVDFCMNNVILKFGCCNVKIWLHKKYNVQEYLYKLKV